MKTPSLTKLISCSDSFEHVFSSFPFHHDENTSSFGCAFVNREARFDKICQHGKSAGDEGDEGRGDVRGIY